MYSILPHKKIIILLSTQRSGSTLLKALLSEAPEIEHINEYNFQSPYKNKYATYFDFYRQGRGSIILLKKPASMDDFLTYPKLPNLQFRSIVLIRNPIPNILSMQKMAKIYKISLSNESTLSYWIKTYENIVAEVDLKSSKNYVLRYEDLIEYPIEITAKLFHFIGSKRKIGTDTYTSPADDWIWGQDDEGDLIKRKKVIKVNKTGMQHDDLERLVLSCNRARKLMQIFDINIKEA